MRPSFLGLEAAKSAIFTNQKALDIVGNNLANVNTNGYTRQRVDTSSIASTAFRTRTAAGRVDLTGQGVEALGVSQTRDSFLDKRFRDEYSKTSYHSQAAGILGEIQSALGDGSDLTADSGLLGAIQQLYASLNDYAGDPTMDTQANLVLSAFRNVTQVLQQMDSKLTGVAQQQIYDLGVNADRVNDIAAQVANLNQQIVGDAAATSSLDNEHYRANELLDQRNLLLDELAGYGDISVKQKADGSVDVDLAGHSLVSGGDFNKVYLTQNEDETVSLKWRGSGENLRLSGGSMQAALDYLNGRGSNVQSPNETSKQGVLYYRDRLNLFANQLAKAANNTIPELGADGKPQVDGNGNTVYKTLLTAGGSDNPKTQVSAGNISISEQWTTGGAGYFIYNKQENAPQYAQQLVTALTGQDSTFVSYGEQFTGTFEEYVTDFITKLGADQAFETGRRDASAEVADDFLNRRDEISGVSKDEETTNMLMYQKSYEAAARMMTTMDELLDVLINRTGRVGL